MLYFGFGANDFYLRLDLSRHPEAITIRFLLPHPARLTLRQVSPGHISTLFETSGDGVLFVPSPASDVIAHWGRSLTVDIPRELLRIEPGHEFAFFVQLLESGLQRERYPERGAIELTAPGKDFEAEHWFV
jgi:hypothetical protein